MNDQVDTNTQVTMNIRVEKFFTLTKRERNKTLLINIIFKTSYKESKSIPIFLSK